MQKFDPNLRIAADEFRALCQKYDCAGVVLFVSPTHSEFVSHISPSWSVVKIESPTALRFRSKREDFSSKDEQARCTNASAHMLTSIVEWSRTLNVGMTSVIRQLRGQLNIMWEAWDEPSSVPGESE